MHLLPHGARELTELGLGDELAAVGIQIAEMVHFDVHGYRVWGFTCGRDAGYSWPQYSVRRGEVLRILRAAVRRRLGMQAVRGSAELTSFEETADGVIVSTRDRVSGASRSLRGDVLVGADGLHSKVRAALHSGDPAPRWDGITVWRGITAGAPFLNGRTIVVCGDNAGLKFVAYPLSRAAEPSGLAEISWAANVKTANGPDRVPRMDRTRQGRIEDLLPRYADWAFDWLDIPALISGTAQVVTYPMVDRDPLDWWGNGRVTLLGEAAHPMYPVGLNGPSQAIIDARVLARELARGDSPEAGLAAYEAARKETVNELVLACRDLPVDRMLRTLSHRAPDGFDQVSDVLTAAEIAAFDDAYRNMSLLDVSALNSRPPLAPPA